MKSRITIFIILLLTISACTKDEPYFRLSSFEAPIVTGYYMRDLIGRPIGTIGVPNIKLGNKSNSPGSEYFMEAYPNPCINFCSIAINTPDGGETKKIWLTRANASDEFANSSQFLNMNNINIGGSPIYQLEFTGNHLALDLSKFDDGYYRIYLKINEITLYDNLVIYKNLKTN